MPELVELSPTESVIGEVSLVTYMPDEAPQSETRQLVDPGAPLSLGRLDVAEGVSLALELRTPNRRLIGYGRSPGTIEVQATETVRVPMKIRRPFVYVSGGTTLATFDSTRDATVTDSYLGQIDVGGSPWVAVPTQDGADLVVGMPAGVGGEMRLVSTSNHRPSELDPIPLSAAPVDAAVTGDNRWVVFAHSGDSGGLSIVDLAAAREGRAEVEFVPLGNVGAVGIGSRASRPKAVALLDRGTGSTCPDTPGSVIAAVDLEDPSVIAPMISHDVPLHDIAVSDDGNTVVAADLCSNRLQKFSLVDDVQPAELTVMQDPTAVAIFDDRAWAVGTLPPMNGQPRRLIVVSVALDGTGETRVELPPSQERAVSADFTDEGQQAEQRMDADDLEAFDIAVVPGADHIAILARGYYHALEDGDFLGQPIIPEMELEAYEYLLVNASTTALVQRVRTWCDLQWVSDPFNPPILDDWDCSLDADQDVAATPYVPQHISILYGGR
jgi:hypothetical protein